MGIAAVGDSAIGNFRPGDTGVEALPNAFTHRIAGRIKRDKPHIHLVASGHDGNLGTVDGTSLIVRCGLRRTDGSVEDAPTGLVGKTCPVSAVRGRVKAVIANCSEEETDGRVVGNRSG